MADQLTDSSQEGSLSSGDEYVSERLINMEDLKLKIKNKKRCEDVLSKEDKEKIGNNIPINIYGLELDKGRYYIGYCKLSNSKLKYEKFRVLNPNMKILYESYFVVSHDVEWSIISREVNKYIYVLVLEMKKEFGICNILSSVAATNSRMKEFIKDFEYFMTEAEIKDILNIWLGMKTVYKDSEDMYLSSFTNRVKLSNVKVNENREVVNSDNKIKNFKKKNS